MATTCSPIVLVPGRPGIDGIDGIDGAAGQPAHTTVDGQFLMPGEGLDVVVNVINSDWMVVGQNYAVETAGTMELISIGSSTQITLRNIEDTALSLYPDNVAVGTVIPDGSDIGVGGIQGAPGIVAGGALLIANDLIDLSNPVAARANLGLGTAATRTVGIGDAQVTRVDDVGGLTAGEALFATVNGVESLADGPARAALGLVIGIADTEIPPVDVAAGLVSGQPVFATAAGLESLTPALARTALGIATGIINRVSFENQAAIDAGAFTSGLWQTVPLNTKDVDTSGTSTLAANQMTLPAGTWSYRAFMTGFRCDRFQCRLLNVTTATPHKYGTTAESNAVANNPEGSWVEGRLTIAVPSVFELQAQCATTRAADGFGQAPLFAAPYNLTAGVYFQQEV